MKLYDITSAYEHLWSLVEDDDADLTMLEDTMQSIEYELEEKTESLVKILRNINSDIEGLKAEEARLNKKRVSLEAKHESIKNWLKINLIQMGKDKIVTNIATVTIANNPPSVNIIDEKQIPDKYKIAQEPKLDKKGMLADLKAEVKVPGAEIQKTKGIRIK